MRPLVGFIQTRSYGAISPEVCPLIARSGGLTQLYNNVHTMLSAACVCVCTEAYDRWLCN